MRSKFERMAAVSGAFSLHHKVREAEAAKQRLQKAKEAGSKAARIAQGLAEWFTGGSK